MILARCLNITGLLHHLWKFGQELVLVWLPGKCCVCLWDGHKKTQMSSFSYVNISHLLEFRWRALGFRFSLQEFLNFLKIMWASLVQGNKLCIFSSREHMLWRCTWCLFWIALLHVWIFRSSECSRASGREGWYFSSEPSSVILPL